MSALQQALRAGRFCYVVELVASALTREAKLLEVATRLARLPEVVAGSITSYAGGAMGHDPLRVGTAVRARGLAPNVHVTCVSQDRDGLRKTLEELSALGLHDVFALTGDYPRDRPQPGASGLGAGPGQTVERPVFDLDSVHLVSLMAAQRRTGRPFHVAVAVSPFKYVEADLLWQYVKLEKKIAAGADLCITQVGWDAEKFRELRRYLDERGLTTPVLGNVYVLGPRTAERMSRGDPPGCWVSPGLLEAVRRESQGPDGGRRARLERAARTVAVLRGLGYAGAYLGGTHDAEQVAWIIRRAEALAPGWENLVPELGYGAEGGFYLYGRERSRRPVPAPAPGELRPPPGQGPLASKLVPRTLDLLGRLFPVAREGLLRRALRGASGWVARRPGAARAVEGLEHAVKGPLFGCQSCGNCVLGHLEYVCPQTCPKQMRNGPCGGTYFGRCEVVPEQPCIWNGVYERARDAGRTGTLAVYVPPPDRSLQGTSSWINYFLERDRRPASGDPEPMPGPGDGGADRREPARRA